MKAEQECQWKKTQQTQPEPGETSGEGSSTSILKVKSQKGKTVEIVQVEDKPVEKKSDESRREDESEKTDEPTEQEETEDKSDTPPIEFEDQMYKLMQETEMMRVPGNNLRMGRRTCFTIDTEGKSQILRNERILPVTSKGDRTRNGAEVS